MEKIESVYISGPMTGYKKFNFPAFDATRDYCKKLGWNVYSPADNDRLVYPECEQTPGFPTGDLTIPDPNKPEKYTFKDLLVWDVWAIGQSQGIVFLPGWQKSTGAGVERKVAEALKLELLYAQFTDDRCSMILAEDPYAADPVPYA